MLYQNRKLVPRSSAVRRTDEKSSKIITELEVQVLES